jgi:hypothetical protein
MEDITVDTFLASSFGTFMMTLFQGTLSAPSWQNFTYLSCGWALAWGRQTITTYMWLSGAATAKHFSRYYAFLGGPLYKARDALWRRIIRYSATLIPTEEAINIDIDDGTIKKSGPHIEGASHYRNGAGSARQEYRTLWGVNLVWAIMRIPLKRWPGHYLSVPIGLELYLKESLARQLNVTYRSRSQLARHIIDLAAQQLPNRCLRVAADGEYATKAFLRHLPDNVEVVGRLLITAPLYKLPPKVFKKGPGAPRKKGERIGSPKTLANTPMGWRPHPQEAGAQVQDWLALWHSVLPGRQIRVVIVRRPHLTDVKRVKGKRTPFGRLKPLEAFFSTDLSLSVAAILSHYQDRWAVEIDIRDAHAFYGIAQDQCRKLKHVIGANTLRLIMAATRTLWFIAQSERCGTINLCRFRPWYRQKVAPSQLDVVWACREALHEAGIFPIPRFSPDLNINQQALETTLPSAA